MDKLSDCCPLRAVLMSCKMDSLTHAFQLSFITKGTLHLSLRSNSHTNLLCSCFIITKSQKSKLEIETWEDGIYVHTNRKIRLYWCILQDAIFQIVRRPPTLCFHLVLLRMGLVCNTCFLTENQMFYFTFLEWKELATLKISNHDNLMMAVLWTTWVKWFTTSCKVITL